MLERLKSFTTRHADRIFLVSAIGIAAMNSISSWLILTSA